MKVLLIGSGGREHAIAWKIAQSKSLTELFIAPGNDAMNELGTITNLNINNFDEVTKFCKDNQIDLVMVGPEDPLVNGIVDHLNNANILCCGPDKFAAQLEGSKAFTHDICAKYNIPAAKYEVFTEKNKALDYLKNQQFPIVIKADGLAAGKGVTIAQNIMEANTAIEDIFAGKFGESGYKAVIEEFLYGDELSFFVICDGKKSLYLGSAQDHKAVGDGDTGPNTGGMGTYSPTPLMNDALKQQVITKIINPTIKAMQDLGHPFKGILFAGLMITKDGPKLLEYNVRFGDPETQVLMLRLKSDLLPILKNAAKGDLSDDNLKWHGKNAVCVVMAAKGYPGSYKKGSKIGNIDEADNMQDVKIFHAGTKKVNGEYIANGGRVLGVTAMGSNTKEATKLAYNAVEKIDWPEGFYRKDIAAKAISHFDNLHKNIS